MCGRRRSRSSNASYESLEPRNVLTSFLPVTASIDLSSPFDRVLLIEADPASENTIVEVDHGRNANGSIDFSTLTVKELDQDRQLIRSQDLSGVVDQIHYIGSDQRDVFSSRIYGTPVFVLGNGGNDFIVGSNVRDRLFGGAGNDTIRGENGSDVIYGNEGNDLIFGDRKLIGLEDGDFFQEKGEQVLETYRDSADTIFGGDGADQIFGGPGNDEIRGEVGNDVIAGQFGNDRLYGGDGADTVAGDFIDINLNAGTDDLRTAILLEGHDFVDGGAGNDNLRGGAGDDRIYGGAGNDLLVGDENTVGNDTLFGGDGNDRLKGRAGNDVLFGWKGDDILEGGFGDDSFSGGEGSDQIFHGLGNDRNVSSDGSEGVLFDEVPADLHPVKIIPIPGVQDDELRIRTGGDQKIDVRVELDSGGNYALVRSRLDSGASIYELIPKSEFDFDLMRVSGSNLDDHIFVSDERPRHEEFRLLGLNGADSITYQGESGDALLNGGGGDDQLSGGSLLIGGNGNDRLDSLGASIYGSDGDDLLFDGKIMHGGNGDDVLRVRVANEHALYAIARGSALYGGVGDDTLINGITMNGGAGDDFISASAVNTWGFRQLVGGAGNDLIQGSRFDDRIFGGDGVDRLFGNGGSDNLFGGNGNDVLFGGNGDDVLHSSPGVDLINGEGGRDLFRLIGDDVIVDFVEGVDRLI